MRRIDVKVRREVKDERMENQRKFRFKMEMIIFKYLNLKKIVILHRCLSEHY